MRERESERMNYARENVIKCTHTSKHFGMNSLVNNYKTLVCIRTSKIKLVN